MSNVSSGISGGAGLGGSLWGILAGNSQNNWGQQSLVNVLNTMNQANSTGLGLGLSAFDPTRNTALETGGLAHNTLNNPDLGVLGMQKWAGNLLGGINPGQFQNPTLASALGGMNLGGANGALGNLASNNGLLNPGQGNAQNTANLFLNGMMFGQPNLYNSGTQMLANNGQSPYGTNLQNVAGGVTSGLGGTQATNFGLGAAQQLINNGGLNSLGATGQAAALQGFLGGGSNSLTQALENTGLNFANQQAVLPTSMAASIAEDQAHQQAQNSAQAAEAQALARGGGPGATVANGATNQASSDFANQISQNSANAYQNALLQQQGLNLQQQGQGAQMALGAGNIASQQLGQYGSLLQQLTGEANTGLGTGLSSLGNLQNAQTNLAGTYGNLGLGAGSVANQTAATGGNLLNDYLNSALGGGSLQNNLLGTQLQGLLGGANGTNNAAANFAQLGQQGTNNYYNSLNGLFNNLYNSNYLGSSLNNQALNSLGNLTGQGLNYAQSGLAGQSNLFQNYASQGLGNANANLNNGLNGIGGSIGQILPLLGLG